MILQLFRSTRRWRSRLACGRRSDVAVAIAVAVAVDVDDEVDVDVDVDVDVVVVTSTSTVDVDVAVDVGADDDVALRNSFFQKIISKSFYYEWRENLKIEFSEFVWVRQTIYKTNQSEKK